MKTPYEIKKAAVQLLSVVPTTKGEITPEQRVFYKEVVAAARALAWAVKPGKEDILDYITKEDSHG